MGRVLVLSSLGSSMSFCPDKYPDKPVFPKANSDEQLCRVMYCVEVRKSKDVNTLFLFREKNESLHLDLYQSKYYEAVGAVLLRHSFSWALIWTHQAVCAHSKVLLHGTAVLWLVFLVRSVASYIVDSVCVYMPVS